MSVGTTVDAKLKKDSLGVYDIQLDSSGDIATENFFDTSILMSIFCERRALASEMPVSQYRRGWIGNEFTEGFEIGSKIWLYEQARLTRSTLNGISSTVKEALNWMVDDLIALELSVSSEVIKGNGISISVSITRPNSSVEKRNYELWELTGK